VIIFITRQTANFFLTKSPIYDTIDSSKRGRKIKCVNVLTAEVPHRFAELASICIFADAGTSGRMMTMKQQKPTTICSVKILRDGKGNAVKIIKIRG
jgi:hypothetical protein